VPIKRRSRVLYACLVAVAVILGLATRRFPQLLPRFVAVYGGDTLWALTAYLLVGLLLPAWPTLRVAGVAMLFALAIELSQLYHAPWIDAVRGTRLAAWILGFEFLWSDLACYAAGVLLGATIEWLVLARHQAAATREQGEPT